MGIAQDIQRNRYMDLKGHNVTTIEQRDIKSDRVLIKRINETKSITKEPKVISNLYELLKGI